MNRFESVRTILTGFEPTVEPGTVNPDFPFSQPISTSGILTGFEPIVEPGTVNPDFPLFPTESVQPDEPNRS